MFPAMPRLMALFVIASVLSSCTSAGVGDYVPNWAGGLPKNAPPRPGTLEYDAYIKIARSGRSRGDQRSAQGTDRSWKLDTGAPTHSLIARSALAVWRHKSPDEACCELTTLKKGIGQDREPAVSNRQDELV